MRKNIFIYLFFIIFLNINCLNTIKILVPKTLSSIPIIELKGLVVENYKIEIEFYDDHSLAMAELINNKTDLLVTGFTQGLSAYNENKNIVLINSYVWGVSSIVVKDKNIDSLVKLSGKKIAVPFQGSPLDYQLRFILSKNNLLDKISIEYLPSQQAVGMLITGKIDAISVPEPLVSKLLLTNNFYILSTFPELWKQLTGDDKSPQVSIFANQKYISKKKKVVIGLRKKLTEIIKNIDSNKESLSDKYRKHFELEKKDLLNSFDRTIFSLVDVSIEKDLTLNYIKLLDFKVSDNNFFYK